MRVAAAKSVGSQNRKRGANVTCNEPWPGPLTWALTATMGASCLEHRSSFGAQLVQALRITYLACKLTEARGTPDLGFDFPFLRQSFGSRDGFAIHHGRLITSPCTRSGRLGWASFSFINVT